MEYYVELTGAEILVESLKKEGVDVIFGYPGGVVIPIFDVLFDDKDIKVILPRHEQGGMHAADGYARATGKVGVMLATSGPGATNLITGIATAFMDSIPVVAITGQVKTFMIGNDAFQEADVTGITRPITKHNYLVKDVKELPKIIKEAFYIAKTGRPGPVVIDLPVDVTASSTEYDYPKEIKMRGYNPTYEGNIKQVKRACELIKESKRPIIYAGGGVIASEASTELRKFVDKTGIPITTTLLALGSVPTDHKLNLGMPGMHGTFYSNYALQDSDLIIAVGSRFDDRVTGKIDEFAPYAKVIHVDIDPTSISKVIPIDVPIVGDCKNILEKLLKYVEKPDIEAWLAKVDDWKKQNPLTYAQEDVIKPQYVVEKMSEILPADAIISTEVGQNQMWAAQFYKFKQPRTLLTSGGLGTMGYGFPAAVGAQVAFPKRKVVDVAGDGSIQMNIQELATIRDYNLPVKILILNNAYLGMVRQWQELFWDKRYSSTCLEKNASCPPSCKGPNDKCTKYIPDFVKLAEAYSVNGYRIEKVKDVEPMLKEALLNDEPAVIDVLIAREENVFPMVPAGKSLNQMIGGMT